MIVSALDSSHDWTFGGNRSDYLKGSDAIKQCVLTSILSVREDWFLNLSYGIDWVNYLGRSTNMALLESDLKSSVLMVDGVYQVTNIDLQLNREKRVATISIEYTDIYNKRILVNTDVTDR